MVERGNGVRGHNLATAPASTCRRNIMVLGRARPGSLQRQFSSARTGARLLVQPHSALQ